MPADRQPARRRQKRVPDRIFRWECRCKEPPVLLGTYEASGRIHIKVRDRYWHVNGQVKTICPRCGAEHVLDLQTDFDEDPGELLPLT